MTGKSINPTLPDENNEPSLLPNKLVSGESQLPVIFILFLTFRVSILFLFSPQGLTNVYTDYNFYYRTAQLSNDGYYPFVNMWYEYPPVSTYITEGAYRLVHTSFPSQDLNLEYMIYTRMLGILVLLFETGVLLLLHNIASAIWDVDRANWVSWIYSALSVPLFYWNGSHQAVMTFFLLLAVYLFIRQKWAASAITLALGIASKLTPILLLAPVVKFLWGKDRVKILRYVSLVLLTTLLIYLPFQLLGGGAWVRDSFVAVGKVQPYGTPWAIIDGYWGPGTYGPLTTRVLPLDQSFLIDAKPPLIPESIKSILFAILFGVFFFRPLRENSPLQFVWFSTLAVLIFHLWSKGWSPQWATTVIPFLLLSFPNKRGLILVLLLSATVLQILLVPVVVFLPSLSQTLKKIHRIFLVILGGVLATLILLVSENISLSILILIRTGIFIAASYWIIQELWSSRLSYNRLDALIHQA